MPDMDDARYAHMVCVAQRFGYVRLNRPDKGVVRYLIATCGYCRAQLSRLLANILDGLSLNKQYRAPAQAFARRHTSADALLLAEVDRARGPGHRAFAQARMGCVR